MHLGYAYIPLFTLAESTLLSSSRDALCLSDRKICAWGNGARSQREGVAIAFPKNQTGKRSDFAKESGCMWWVPYNYIRFSSTNKSQRKIGPAEALTSLMSWSEKRQAMDWQKESLRDGERSNWDNEGMGSCWRGRCTACLHRLEPTRFYGTTVDASQNSQEVRLYIYPVLRSGFERRPVTPDDRPCTLFRIPSGS
jgi:hypothetical protein